MVDDTAAGTRPAEQAFDFQTVARAQQRDLLDIAQIVRPYVDAMQGANRPPMVKIVNNNIGSFHAFLSQDKAQGAIVIEIIPRQRVPPEGAIVVPPEEEKTFTL